MPQDDAAATYCRRLQKEDGALDFAAPATELAARINGLFPWPACSVRLNGQAVKLGLADALASQGGVGEVTGADSSGLLVGTGLGLLRLRRLQRPGGRLLEAEEFLRGFPVPAGTRLASNPMPPLLSTRA
jgi:methionyl-tRNA formyltransferase